MEKLKVLSSPHISHNDTTSGIMLDVILALLPATICSFFFYGFGAIVLVAATVASAVASEYLWCQAIKKETSLKDLSAVVTGLLLALNLPPDLPVWMAVLGGGIAIVIVKQMFGGLGHNFANPAMTARIVLMISFPTAMTTFTVPFTDTVSSATPLAELVSETPDLMQLFLGYHAGCMGETSALLLLVGGVYLVIRKVITPTIPLAFILSAGIFAAILGVNPVTTVLTGGIMLGAIYMATDYATSPPTFLGQVIFGVGCGIITVIIRVFGNLPEGVSFGILIMNILTPQITKLTSPKPFATEGKKNEK